jgi:uracil-DNA glycosylase
MKHASLASLQKQIIACSRCSRLVRWRQATALEKVRRFADEEYWGKPIPSFGDPRARLLLVGLAPAAHGGNRTGRMFTGDESGNWLFRALYAAGFANQATSISRNDGLVLKDCYVTATLRCAPPQNKPTAVEIASCAPYLRQELKLLTRVGVVIGLGKIGFEAALRGYRDLGRITFTTMPRFGHGATFVFDDLTVLASYHPSQQNTFTGRLTQAMFDGVFVLARRELEKSSMVQESNSAKR